MNKPIEKNEFIYLPNLKIFVAKQGIYLGNWFESHEELLRKGLNMPTIPEFLEFLKYLYENPSTENIRVYNEITQIREPWRAEWLDADFKFRNGMCINYNHFLDSSGRLIPKDSELLDENTLIRGKTSGISLENYFISSHTKQGLPTKSSKLGYLSYWPPGTDDNAVTEFITSDVKNYLSCDKNPSNRDSAVGVRAVRRG